MDRAECEERIVLANCDYMDGKAIIKSDCCGPDCSPPPPSVGHRNQIRLESINNRPSNLSKEEENWKKTGKKTITVKIGYEKGREVFSFSGQKQDKTPRAKLLLEEGVTYRFNLRDPSLFHHPLSFATSSDGEHNITNSEMTDYIYRSKKPQGNRGSYVYFNVPYLRLPIYYYCKHHERMGNKIDIITKAFQNDANPITPSPRPPITVPGDFPTCDSCCGGACLTCLIEAMRRLESDPDNDGDGSEDNCCCNNSCNCKGDCCGSGGGNSCTCEDPDFDCDGECGSCGPFQIRQPAWDSAFGNPPDTWWSCPLEDLLPNGYTPENGRAKLCEDCPSGNAGSACCAAKEQASRIFMLCNILRFSRPGSGNPCLIGTGPGGCWTCEDFARHHNGGYCGHREPGTLDYWEKIKKKLKEMGGSCCHCCASGSVGCASSQNSCGCDTSVFDPVVKVPISKRISTPQTTRPPRTTTPRSTTPRPTTPRSTTSPPYMGGGSSSSSGY